MLSFLYECFPRRPTRIYKQLQGVGFRILTPSERDPRQHSTLPSLTSSSGRRAQEKANFPQRALRTATQRPLTSLPSRTRPQKS